MPVITPTVMSSFYILPPDATGEPSGPYAPDTIRNLRQAGTLTDNHLVAQEGAAEWKTLVAQFGAIPPESTPINGQTRPRQPMTPAAAAKTAIPAPTTVTTGATAGRKVRITLSVIAVITLTILGAVFALRRTPTTTNVSAANPPTPVSVVTKEHATPTPPAPLDESWKQWDARPVPDLTTWNKFSQAPADAPFPPSPKYTVEYGKANDGSDALIYGRPVVPNDHRSNNLIMDAKPGPLSTCAATDTITLGGRPFAKLKSVTLQETNGTGTKVIWAIDPSGKPIDPTKITDFNATLRTTNNSTTHSLNIAFELLENGQIGAFGTIYRNSSSDTKLNPLGGKTKAIFKCKFEVKINEKKPPRDLLLCLFGGKTESIELPAEIDATSTCFAGTFSVIHLFKHPFTHGTAQVIGDKFVAIRKYNSTRTFNGVLIQGPFGISRHRTEETRFSDIEPDYLDDRPYTNKIYTESARIRFKLPPLPCDSAPADESDPLDRRIPATARNFDLNKAVTAIAGLRFASGAPSEILGQKVSQFAQASTVRELLRDALRATPGWKLTVDRNNRTLKLKREA